MEKCSVIECGRPSQRQQYCDPHYLRWYRYGDPEKGRAIRKDYEGSKPCSIEGCGKPVRSRGWCQTHYDRWHRHGDPSVVRKIQTKRQYSQGEVCEVDGCGKPRYARTYCSPHYQSALRHGDPLKAKWRVNAQARHQWHINHQGYVWRYEPTHPLASKSSGYVFQHRAVMADLIGRPLRSNENVHHKNGNKADNAPGNLELWISNQPPGQRVQDLVAWARQIIAEYAELVV